MRIGCQITGDVQGVGFRFWTQQTARRHNLVGWVKNEPDGSVHAVFDGAKEDVETMLEACRIGPTAARVTDVRQQTVDKKDASKDHGKNNLTVLDSFEIVR